MKTHIFAAAAMLMASSTIAQANDQEQWSWTVAPYIWAQSAAVDLAVDGEPSIASDAKFGDLIDKVDMAFMGHVEARRDRWGIFVDVVYLDLSDESMIPEGALEPDQPALDASSGLTTSLIEAGAAYRVGQGETAPAQLDLLLGLRYVKSDVDTLLRDPDTGEMVADIRTDSSETDLMLGLRLMGDFNERWSWLTRADYSFLGTEGSYNGLATVGYTFGDSGSLSMHAGYRFMHIDIDGTTSAGATTNSDIDLSGPLLVLMYDF